MRAKETTSIISCEDWSSEVLLNLPMSPGPASKKLEPGLQDVLSTPESELAQQGYLFRFWFSHSTVYIWPHNRWMEKETRIQKSKGHFLLLSYALARLAARLQARWHVQLGDHPSCPDTWQLCYGAGVWLSASGKAQPRLVVRRSMHNSPRIQGGMLAPPMSSVNSWKHCLSLFHRLERKIHI